MSRCPSASMTARASRTVAVLPSMTRSMLCTMALVAAAKSDAGSGLPSSSAVLGMVTGLLLGALGGQWGHGTPVGSVGDGVRIPAGPPAWDQASPRMRQSPTARAVGETTAVRGWFRRVGNRSIATRGGRYLNLRAVPDSARYTAGMTRAVRLL